MAVAPASPREVIAALYAALATKDIARVLPLLSDGIVLDIPGPSGVGGAGRYHGLEGAKECFRRLEEGRKTEKFEFLERIHDGEHVVSRLHMVGIVTATGKRFEMDVVHFWTVKGGKVTRLLDFFDTAAVADAFGHTTI